MYSRRAAFDQPAFPIFTSVSHARLGYPKSPPDSKKAAADGRYVRSTTICMSGVAHVFGCGIHRSASESVRGRAQHHEAPPHRPESRLGEERAPDSDIRDAEEAAQTLSSVRRAPSARAVELTLAVEQSSA